MLEAKMALIELLKRYTFVRAPDTEVKQNSLSELLVYNNIIIYCTQVPLKLMLGFTLTPKNNAIFLKVIPRN